MTRARASLVAGGGIVLAIALALFIGRSAGRGSAPGTELDRAPTPEVVNSNLPADAPELPIASTRDVAATEPSPPPTPAEEEEDADVGFSFDLHGRVLGQGSDGSELAPQDGRFLLSVWCGDMSQTLNVEVRAGEWQAKSEGPCAVDALRVSRLESGELRPRLVQPDDRVPIPASHELEIRFRIPRAVQLRVLDAATGAGLSAIELVRLMKFERDQETHPGAEFQARILGHDLKSPIGMDRFRQSLELYRNGPVLVGAPGYAWRRAVFDFDLGGEFVVLLERGGDLDLSVSGVDKHLQSHLRIRSGGRDSPVCEEELQHDGTLSFVGLVPGVYSVRAELGEWFGSPVLLGETTVAVLARELARAELVISPAPQIARANIGGIVYIPSEWKEDSPTLLMEQLSTPLDGSDAYAMLDGEAIESARKGYDAFRWHRDRVEVGKYEFGMLDPFFSVVIDVPHGGRSDFELVVPPPVELSIFLVDDATGTEIVTDGLGWNPRRPEGVDGGQLLSPDRDAPNHRYVIRAPACEIELQLWLWEYMAYDAVVDLSKGVREHTIRLRPSCGVKLKLKDGDNLVAFSSEWTSAITTVSGNGKQGLTDFGEFERKFTVTEPGTYSIVIPKLPNYRPIPPQTIEVSAGRFTEHVVQLEREHP